MKLFKYFTFILLFLTNVAFASKAQKKSLSESSAILSKKLKDLPDFETVQAIVTAIEDSNQKEKYLIEILDNYVKLFDELANKEALSDEEIAMIKDLVDRIAYLQAFSIPLKIPNFINPDNKIGEFTLGDWEGKASIAISELKGTKFNPKTAQLAARLFLALEEYPIKDYTDVKKAPAGKLSLVPSRKKEKEATKISSSSSLPLPPTPTGATKAAAAAAAPTTVPAPAKAPGKKESATKASSSSSLPLPPTPTGATKAAVAVAAPTTVPATAAVPAVKVGLDLPTIETVKNTAAEIADDLEQRKYLIETLDKYVKTFDELANKENLSQDEILSLKLIFDRIVNFYDWKKGSLSFVNRLHKLKSFSREDWREKLVQVHKKLGEPKFDPEAAQLAAKLFLALEDYPIEEYIYVDRERAGKLNLLPTPAQRIKDTIQKAVFAATDKVKAYQGIIQNMRSELNNYLASSVSAIKELLNTVRALTTFLRLRGPAEKILSEFNQIAYAYDENPNEVQKNDLASKITAVLDILEQFANSQLARGSW